MAELHQLHGDGTPPVVANPPPRKRRKGQAWRSRFVNEAAHEIEAIGVLLQREFATPDPGIDSTLVRSLGARLEELSGIVFAADDENDTEADVAERLRGPEAARSRSRKLE